MKFVDLPFQRYQAYSDISECSHFLVKDVGHFSWKSRSKSNLFICKWTHSGNKPCFWDVCGSSFTQISNLYVNTLKREGTFLWSIWVFFEGKSFIHMSTHWQEAICLLILCIFFYRKSKLTSSCVRYVGLPLHRNWPYSSMLKHTVNCPYCEVCRFSFSLKSDNLWRNILVKFLILLFLHTSIFWRSALVRNCIFVCMVLPNY